MTGIRIQVVTIETDNASPEVMQSIRRLLRRAMQSSGSVVARVEQPRPAPPVAPKPAAAPPVREPVVEPAKSPAPVFWEPPAKSPAEDESEPEPEQPAPVAAPQRRAEDDIRDVVQASSTAAEAPLMLEDRVLAAATRSPGVTVDNLIIALLGKADGDSRRRVNMVVSNLQATGKIMRANGQLFPAGYRGKAAAPPPKPVFREDGRSDESTKDRARDLIMAAFAQDNAYSINKLAAECFGDSTGGSTRRVRHMLYQLGVHGKLRNVGPDQWAPVVEEGSES